MSVQELYAAAGLTLDEIEAMPQYLEWDDSWYTSSAFGKLYTWFAFQTGEMPLAVAKARSEDPGVWILDRIEEYQGETR